jgi:hypothetical protein
MADYCFPEKANQKEWIESLRCSCKNCRNVFVLELPLDDGVVKLVEKDGTQVKWLPMFGTGGWLDLEKIFAPRLVEEKLNIRTLKKLNFVKLSGAISMKISRIMDVELPKHTEKGELGNGFVQGDYSRRCPKCRSKDLNFIKEQKYEISTLDWVKIDCSLLK